LATYLSLRLPTDLSEEAISFTVTQDMNLVANYQVSSMSPDLVVQGHVRRQKFYRKFTGPWKAQRHSELSGLRKIGANPTTLALVPGQQTATIQLTSDYAKVGKLNFNSISLEGARAKQARRRKTSIIHTGPGLTWQGANSG